jgi:hypothetical protein
VGWEVKLASISWFSSRLNTCFDAHDKIIERTSGCLPTIFAQEKGPGSLAFLMGSIFGSVAFSATIGFALGAVADLLHNRVKKARADSAGKVIRSQELGGATLAR